MAAPWKVLLTFKQTVKHCVATVTRPRSISIDSKTDLVKISKEGPLHLIGINRPEKRNCVNYNTAVQLKKAFENFSDDSNAHAAVLYGVGGTFCAGYDLQEVASGDGAILSAEMGPMGPTRMLLNKPVVAAIDGYAVAGGLELALWCDLRVMEETAKLGVYCRRFGVPLIDGGTVRLPKLIGLARALDLILTGRGVEGHEAYEMGLISKLCKKGEAFKVAVDLAYSLCDFPQKGIQVDKTSTIKASFESTSLEEGMKWELEKASQVFEDAAKGAEEFVKGFGRHGNKMAAKDSTN